MSFFQLCEGISLCKRRGRLPNRHDFLYMFSKKCFTEVNLGIVWQESNFLFSLVIWNILKQLQIYLNLVVSPAGGNWNYAGMLVTFEYSLFLEKGAHGLCCFLLLWVFGPLCKNLATAAQHHMTQDLHFSNHGPSSANCCHSVPWLCSSAGRNSLTRTAD